MKKCSHKEVMPMREWNVMKKAPRIDGMKVATRRQENSKFNQPMQTIYYKKIKQD